MFEIDSKKLITQLHLIPHFVTEVKKVDKYKCLKDMINLKTLAAGSPEGVRIITSTVVRG